LENILIIIDADDTCYDFPEYNSDKRHIRRARRRRGLQYYYCSRKSRFSERRVGLFQRMLKRVFTKLNIQDDSPTMLTSPSQPLFFPINGRDECAEIITDIETQLVVVVVVFQANMSSLHRKILK